MPGSIPDRHCTLSAAAVVVRGDRTVRRATALLVEEVEKRTRLRWPITESAPPGSIPCIVVGTAAELSAIPGLPASVLDTPGPEGFCLWYGEIPSGPCVVVAGHDARGVLFGVGKLLRTLRMERDRVTLPLPLDLSSAPHYPLRGHQLGYRPKTNSYDGWDLRQWEQYIRDLAVWGTNAIELIPPRSDDDADSPHFPLPPMEMMAGMSQLADDYGLDVWIWYPAMDPDYSDPGTVEAAIEEWGEVFRKLPRVDAVFVPGGDPGHTQPRHLFALLERQAENLRRCHPAAGMWVAPQGFSREWMDEFLELTAAEPEWLAGVVFGPQCRLSLRELRASVPERYPIRHYPDITHTLKCQYPVREWDVAFAVTEGREPINPRPLAQWRIFGATDLHVCGFITYSEGCNDDVNKIIWSSLGWDPEQDPVETLTEYGRYFIGERLGYAFGQGLLGLEENWRGPLIANTGVARTLQQFQALERLADPGLRLNWRFQQALYRAYYDAYVQRRLRYETERQDAALEVLRRAGELGSFAAISEAERIFEEAARNRPAQDWRARVFELAEALFQCVRMQLSVERYAAIDVGRGANLDTIDVPLNDAPWWKAQLDRVRTLLTEADRCEALDRLLHWTDPGPGGHYCPALPPEGPGVDDCEPDWWSDPGGLQESRIGYTVRGTGRLSWCRFVESAYDTPLRMDWYDLDPDARYRLRVIYAPEGRGQVRLETGNGIEIHPLLVKPDPPEPLEWEIPREVTAEGKLSLIWTGEPGRGGNGRGVQIAELWISIAAE